MARTRAPREFAPPLILSSIFLETVSSATDQSDVRSNKRIDPPMTSRSGLIQDDRRKG